MEPQTLKNHTRLHPLYHFFVAPLSFAVLIFTIVDVIRNPGWSGVAHLLAGLWVFGATILIRIYPLKVQDRVIRLEERLRLRDVLPASLQPRIGELTEDQFTGLRFASDAELPHLVSKALAGNWKRKPIKEAIRVWRPDYWRV
jgi:hypothetical protein